MIHNVQAGRGMAGKSGASADIAKPRKVLHQCVGLASNQFAPLQGEIVF